MEPKDEMIEEIQEVEELSADDKKDKENKDELKEEGKEKLKDESKTEALIIDPIINDTLSNDDNNETLLVEENNDNSSDENETEEKNVQETYDSPKKSKAPLIVLLSILLVLDISALVIYIIGVEKVISFIK